MTPDTVPKEKIEELQNKVNADFLKNVQAIMESFAQMGKRTKDAELRRILTGQVKRLENVREKKVGASEKSEDKKEKAKEKEEVKKAKKAKEPGKREEPKESTISLQEYKRILGTILSEHDPKAPKESGFKQISLQLNILGDWKYVLDDIDASETAVHTDWIKRGRAAEKRFAELLTDEHGGEIDKMVLCCKSLLIYLDEIYSPPSEKDAATRDALKTAIREFSAGFRTYFDKHFAGPFNRLRAAIDEFGKAIAEKKTLPEQNAARLEAAKHLQELLDAKDGFFGKELAKGAKKPGLESEFFKTLWDNKGIFGLS